MKQSLFLRIFSYTFLGIGTLFILGPIFLTVSIAMKSRAETTKSFLAPPSGLYLDNFIAVINKANFWSIFQNSVFITLVSLLLMLIAIPMVSYAVSRNSNHMYYRFVYTLILLGIFVPFQAIMLPIYRHMSNLELLNQGGLIIMYLTLSFSQGLFLCVGFLKNIPLELDQASKIDGCGVWLTFTRVIYPLMMPILATILILNSLWIWNDFQLPLIMLNRHPDYWTLPLFIYNFKSEVSFDYNLAFAAFTLSMAPISILYVFTQRYIIGGLTEGSIK
ncbi:sugar ABC transporter permease [Paenibacillus cisolokensis]|jgi:ABC-type sugar transport system, permease component|uniref:Sugar ABC transporter permease n=1 Tax=Paenibacillus cisolokensis TaxID=1658519 RepID=A0ABQ4N8V4_9BACL|nr:carbohydrate ABC transporter permease [Paenibacillus cisolokensis]GIQ64626.1 sugar ABC transporter permease [Paenibacillus cisolokensis]